MKIASLSDVGKKRQINQDTIYSFDLPIGNLRNLFVVADGMGGHKAGDYASRYAVDTLVSYAKECEETEAQDILKNAIQKANGDIYALSESDSDYEGMGTTLVAAVIEENRMKVVNVGDSRLYLLRNRKIRQITKDHSLVEEMINRGALERENARLHPQKNIITRAVGVFPTVDIDYFDVEITGGDKILLCSDGLSNMLDDEEIRMIIHAGRDILEMAEDLVKAANENGGKDNISLIIIEPFADEVEHD